VRCLICSVCLVIGVTAASAAPHYTVTVAGKPNALTCTVVDHKLDPTPALGVQVIMKNKLKRKQVSVDLDGASSQVLAVQDVQGAAGGTSSFAPGDAASFTLHIDTDQGAVACDAIGLKPGKVERLAEISDDDAARWWASEDGLGARDRFLRAGKQRGLPDDPVLLVHLPSGRLVAPSPSSLRDRSVVQVVVISSHASGFDMVPKECAAPAPLRLLGDPAPAGAVKQAARGGLGATPPISLVGAGAYVQCGAGTLTYDLSYGAGDATRALSTTKLTIRPTFTLAIVTAVGFDTTVIRDYAAVRAEQLGTGNVIGNQHTKVGPSVLVGGQWMLGNVDYTDMRWYNYVLNPFVAVDVSAPLSGFVVGDTLTLTGGISLALGLAVHPGVRLKGSRLDDPLADAADPQKQADWNAYHLGLFVGVALDSKIFKALSSAP
jgi:hypothetical protein